MNAPKLIGLVGGMSWESTALYYRYLNEVAQARLGGHHGAHCVIHSLDFEPILQAGAAQRWNDVAAAIIKAGRSLRSAGATFFLLTANSAHRVAEQVEAAVGLPLLHIASATGEALRQDGRQRVGLIGTRYVTEDGFYADWIGKRFGIEVVPPDAPDRARLHAIVIDELTRGEFRESSRSYVQELVAKMRAQHLDAVIVGCTELPLLLSQPLSLALPCYDTARLHAAAALAAAGVPGNGNGNGNGTR